MSAPDFGHMLPHRARQIREQQRRMRFAWWRSPWPAYGLSFLLLLAWGVSASGFWRPSLVSAAPHVELSGVNVLALDQANTSVAAKAATGAPLLLSFTIPYRADYQYRAKLVDKNNATIAEFSPVRASNDQGLCFLRLQRGTLPSQAYRLLVQDQAGNEHHFYFRLE